MFPRTYDTKIMLNKPANKVYFDYLSKYDLSARSTYDNEDYLAKYMSNIQKFEEKERYLLLRMINDANRMISSHIRFNKIKWKLAKLCCKTENGFPHTIGDTIILPNNFLSSGTYHQQLETLIHEKVHLFQRQYPLLTNILITQYWNYNIIGLRTDLEFARANPDLNKIIYSKLVSNPRESCYSKYNSGSPKSLYDSSLTQQCSFENDTYEHPFEKMAYMIANLLVRGDIDKNDDYIALVRWMSKYF